MKSLENLMESWRKQNDLTRNFSGALGINNAPKQIGENLNKNTLHGFTGLDSIAKLTRDMTEKFAAQNLGISNSLSALLKTHSLIDTTPFPSLENALPKWSQQSLTISERLVPAFQAQLDLSKTLSALANSFNPTINQFNVLSAAIQGLSYNYINKAAKNSFWDDIEIVKDADERLTAIVAAVDVSPGRHSEDGLENLKNSIISELTPIFQKSKSERAKIFILDLIALISFILAIYDFNNSKDDLTNKEIIEITSKKISKLRTDIELILEDRWKSLRNTRMASTDVNLRYSDKKNSQILGVVAKGQQVLVIEIRHKWLFVTYLDDKTKRPMSGFVLKKYFKSED